MIGMKMKPEYTLDNWVVFTSGKRLIGISSQYGDYVCTSTILGRHGNKIETRNSIYNLLECSIPDSKEDMLKDIKVLV